MRVGALGGPGTFAAQAAERFVGDGLVTYFPSARDEWEALASGTIEALVMLEESSATGLGSLAERAARPDFGYYVLAEAQVAYGCLLLAKPGSAVSAIRQIFGHGSVAQCKAYLDQHFPDVTVVVEQTSSLEAAEKVARGDGTLAVVGTAKTAERFDLNVLARDIDRGATGNYWLIGSKAMFDERPRKLIVSGRLDVGDQLGKAIHGLANAGYGLRTLASWPTGQALFEYDYLLALAGEGELGSLRRVMDAVAPLRLVGAFSDLIGVRGNGT